MKRSTSLKLVVMATAGVSLTACGQFEEKADGRVFVDREACISSKQYTVNQCTAAFKVASSVDKNSAPRYSSQRLCEEQHGNYSCKPAYGQQGGYASYFAPIAAGYFIAKTTSNLQNWNNRVRPIYSGPKRRHFYTGGGHLLDMASNSRPARISTKATSKPPKVARVQTRTTVASRGGFGSRSGRSFGG